MRAFFGTTLVALGLAAALLFGLGRLFAYDLTRQAAGGQAGIALFLIPGGEIMAICGAILAREHRPGHHSRISQWLFVTYFIATCALIVAGLLNVFNFALTFISLTRMTAGAIGAFASASNAVRDER